MSGGLGKISIALNYERNPEHPAKGEALDSGWAQLVVSDDGPGLPGDIDLSQVRSMGFRLLNLLIRQLHGQVEFSQGPGAAVRVRFPLSPQEADAT